jgi:AraC-like DNA-binding protein/tetratricopeptide (TPR) repeat protein
VKPSKAREDPVRAIRERARCGDLRGAAEAARKAIDDPVLARDPARRAELRLVAAFCEMRQGQHGDALKSLDAAGEAARAARPPRTLPLRVDAWRAELAYFQGRYSAAEEIIERILPGLERAKDEGTVAFVLRTRIAILLARADYEAIADVAPLALAASERSGDPYVRVQVLNILGAVHFDRATSKLAEPHARAHLPALDAEELAPMRDDAMEALHFFTAAREAAMEAGYEFAAWYVSGNIERLQILLGRAGLAVRAIRKRLRVLQQRGAKYDEIVTRSNLAWGLRLLGRHAEALHELDVGLGLARQTGTFNVLLEFIHYDRSVVLDALGDSAGARSSYRRYLRLASGAQAGKGNAPPSAASKRPLEPFFLKRADRFIAEHLSRPLEIDHLARHCGVSTRTLEKAFTDFRGLTPVVHVRNLRLDEAHRALAAREGSVLEVSTRCGFGSSTTFANEYRRRFGVSPSQTLLAARTAPCAPETCGIR